MTEHVVVDEQPTALGVHYQVSIADAEQHFRDAGFHGIHDLRRMESDLNCNEARRRALDAAKRGEGKVFWQGAWDYSANRCCIYSFDFTSYDGPLFGGPATPDTRAHVDWRGN